jgi:tetratricopeptide (TPR) repeat protein
MSVLQKMILVLLTQVLCCTIASANDRDVCKAPGLPTKATIEACGRAILSGQYRGVELANLHSQRAFLNEQISFAQGKPAHERARASLPDLSEAVRLDPTNGSLRVGRCGALVRSGALSEAIADCNDGVRLSKGDFNLAGAHTIRGLAHRRMGKHDDAIGDYTAALKFIPRYAPAYHGRGCAKLAKKDMAGGRADIDEAKKIEPRIEAVSDPC